MNKTLRVLHVEDRERDVKLLTRHLTRAGYEVISQRVETAEAMKAALAEREWDVILCDYVMPQFNALGALAVLKQSSLDIPLIIISGTVGEDVAVEAMRAGANDYLMKDNLVRLTAAIERELQEAENRRARKRAEEALKTSEAELRALFAAMNDVILVLDADGRYLKIPETDPTYLYKPSANLLGKLLHEVFPKEQADFFLAQISRALNERRTHRVEYSMHLGEKEVWFDGSVSPMTDRSVVWVGRDITERKHASAALEESETRFRMVAENLGEGIFITDLDDRILYVNSRMAEIIGYNREELLGELAYKLLLPEEEWPAFLQHNKKRAEGQPERYELQVLRKDRTRIWLEVNAAPYRNLAGEIIGTLAANTDISERKRAEQALRESEERYRELFESNPYPMWVFDLDTLRFLAVNDAAVSHYGYSREEFLKLTIADIRPSEDVPQLMNDLAREPTGGITASRHCKKDGAIIDVEISSQRLVFGNRPAQLVLALDVTARKKAEAALRESEERYRDLVENAHDIIYTHDLEGNYTSINKAAEAITGYSVEEALKLNLADSTAPEYLPKVREMLQRKLAGERGTAYETVIIAKDGRRITVEANTKLVYQDGMPVGVQGIARDVTERKLLEDQLRQSQKMEAIGQLAGGVAHDFNNLLTAINGYSSLALRRVQDDDPVKGYLEEINKAGDRAANLTRQLLAFGRKQILQPVSLNLNDVVNDMTKMLRRLIGEDVELTTRLGPDLKRIKADPGQIEQVLVNLVVNARDAMPAGGKLTIETTNFEVDSEYAGSHVGVPPGNYVMLAVTDSGHGMDDATKARIFEPFFTTKEKGKGTGLGLSTVYGIVQQSGGSIWVYSEIGQGTSFKIYLREVVEAVRPIKGTPRSDQVIPRGTETILLVEDEEVVRGLTQKILEQSGYQVLAASGRDEALQLWSEQQPKIDLLLTDVVMPGASGKEIADRLGDLAPGLKVIFMSGYTDEAIVHHGILDSHVEFIQKPFTPYALSRKVRQVLDGNGSEK